MGPWFNGTIPRLHRGDPRSIRGGSINKLNKNKMEIERIEYLVDGMRKGYVFIELEGTDHAKVDSNFLHTGDYYKIPPKEIIRIAKERMEKEFPNGAITCKNTSVDKTFK